MVVDGDREHAFGVALADHIIVEHPADIARPRYTVARFDQRRLVLLTDDVHAELDAFVADKDGRPGDQLPDFMLALAAEGAVQRILRVAAAGLGHCRSIPCRTRSIRLKPLRPREGDGSTAALSQLFKYMCSGSINH